MLKNLPLAVSILSAAALSLFCRKKDRTRPSPASEQASDRLREMGSSEYEKFIVRGQKPVLVVFGAEWCKPCVELEKNFRIPAKWRNKVEFFKIDFPSIEVLAEERKGSDSLPAHFFNNYEVHSFPSALLFQGGGRVIGRYESDIDDTGSTALQGIVRLLEKSLPDD